MKLMIKNIEYFEWEVPDEIVNDKEKNDKTEQDLIDEFFQPDDISVDQTGDTYYELMNIL